MANGGCMKFLDLDQFRANLSQYMAQVQNSKDAIVVCKDGKPLCQIVPYEKGLAKSKKREKASVQPEFLSNNA